MSGNNEIVVVAACMLGFILICSGQIEPKNTRVLEHVSSGKCLTVSEEFVIFLDDCPW